MHKRLFLLLTTVGIILSLTACAQPPKHTARDLPTLTGVSYKGDIPKTPKRVVSIDMGLTGNALTLDLPVVGATSFDLANPALKDKLTDAKAVSSNDLEGIASLNPDVILAYANEPNLDKLEKIAPVVIVDWEKQTDLTQILSGFGKIFGKESDAKRWITSWQAKMMTAKDIWKKQLTTTSTVSLLEVSDTTLTLFGKDFGRGGEIVYQGMALLAPVAVQEDVFPKRYLTISQEKLPEMAGDVLIVTTPHAQATAPLFSSSIWKNLPAVRSHRVIFVDSALFDNTDPLSLDAQYTTLIAAIQQLPSKGA